LAEDPFEATSDSSRGIEGEPLSARMCGYLLLRRLVATEPVV